MKKLLILATVVLLFGSIFSACKSHERCPAYGKADTQNTEKSS